MSTKTKSKSAKQATLPQDQEEDITFFKQLSASLTDQNKSLTAEVAALRETVTDLTKEIKHLRKEDNITTQKEVITPINLVSKKVELKNKSTVETVEYQDDNLEIENPVETTAQITPTSEIEEILETETAAKMWQTKRPIYEKKGNIPPFYVKNIFNWKLFWETIEKAIPEGKEIAAKTSKGTTIKLQPKTIEQYKMLRTHLESSKTNFYTNTLEEEKTLKAVIRGLPINIDTKDIQDDLRDDLGYDTIKVTRLHKIQEGQKIPMPLYLIELQMSNDNKAIFEEKRLLHCKISVENFKAAKGPTQCYRCQGIGHAQKTCSMDPNCVKCAGQHIYHECTKKREDGPAKCYNCGGKHPANYRGCTFFKTQEIKKKSEPLSKKNKQEIPREGKGNPNH